MACVYEYESNGNKITLSLEELLVVLQNDPNSILSKLDYKSFESYYVYANETQNGALDQILSLTDDQSNTLNLVKSENAFINFFKNDDGSDLESFKEGMIKLNSVITKTARFSIKTIQLNHSSNKIKTTYLKNLDLIANSLNDIIVKDVTDNTRTDHANPYSQLKDSDFEILNENLSKLLDLLSTNIDKLTFENRIEYLNELINTAYNVMGTIPEDIDDDTKFIDISLNINEIVDVIQEFLEKHNEIIELDSQFLNEDPNYIPIEFDKISLSNLVNYLNKSIKKYSDEYNKLKYKTKSNVKLTNFYPNGDSDISNKPGVDLSEASSQINYNQKNHLTKDNYKSLNANKFIGDGGYKSSAMSATLAYKQIWEKSGKPTNSDSYLSSDVVFVSVNGKFDNRVPLNYDLIDKAIEAGANFLTDSTYRRIPHGKNEKNTYNIGEVELANYLISKGYVEQLEYVAYDYDSKKYKPLVARWISPKNQKSFNFLDNSLFKTPVSENLNEFLQIYYKTDDAYLIKSAYDNFISKDISSNSEDRFKLSKALGVRKFENFNWTDLLYFTSQVQIYHYLKYKRKYSGVLNQYHHNETEYLKELNDMGLPYRNINFFKNTKRGNILEIYQKLHRERSYTFSNKTVSIEFVTHDIKNSKGVIVGAQTNYSENKMKLNIKTLKEKYEKKSWTVPYELSDGTRATALPEDQFKSYEEFETFVILHEFFHFLHPIDKNETKGEYEDRINRFALEHIENNFIAVNKKPIKSKNKNEINFDVPEELSETLSDFAILTNNKDGSEKTWNEIAYKFGLTNKSTVAYVHIERILKHKDKNEMISKIESALDKAYSDIGKTRVTYDWNLASEEDLNVLPIYQYLLAAYSNSIIGIGNVIEINETDKNGNINNTNRQKILGNMELILQLSINLNKPTYVFDQDKNKWFVWNNDKFIETDVPILTTKFIGTGTAKINENGKKAIFEVYKKNAEIIKSKRDNENNNQNNNQSNNNKKSNHDLLLNNIFLNKFNSIFSDNNSPLQIISQLSSDPDIFNLLNQFKFIFGKEPYSYIDISKKEIHISKTSSQSYLYLEKYFETGDTDLLKNIKFQTKELSNTFIHELVHLKDILVLEKSKNNQKLLSNMKALFDLTSQSILNLDDLAFFNLKNDLKAGISSAKKLNNIDSLSKEKFAEIIIDLQNEKNITNLQTKILNLGEEYGLNFKILFYGLSNSMEMQANFITNPVILNALKKIRIKNINSTIFDKLLQFYNKILNILNLHSNIDSFTLGDLITKYDVILETNEDLGFNLETSIENQSIIDNLNVPKPKLKVETFNGEWTRDEVAKQIDKVFLFEDNIEDSKKGYIPSKTQAVIRGLPNAIGIDTKKNRGTNEGSIPAPSAKGKMTFSYGNNKREDVTADTTLEAIKRGERTATTRYESDGKIDYWKNLKVGDIIEWEGQGGEKILVEVTKPLQKLKEKGLNGNEWSKLEGWSLEYYLDKVFPRIDEAWQIEYKLAQPKDYSYFSDADFDQFKQQVDEAIQKAKDSGKTIVIPANGIVTDESKLKEKAPKLAQYLNDQLELLKIEAMEILPADQILYSLSSENNNIDSIIDEMIESGEITYTDEQFNPCAKHGLTDAVSGTNWRIAKEFKGKSHEEGGIDIKFSDNGWSFRRNGKDIKAENGLLVVSELYKQKTGKDWSTAKKEGLTDGSYKNNMKLREKLLNGEFDNNNVSIEKNNQSINNDYAKAKDFNEAFKIARKQLGANQIFEFQGKKYGTNLEGEKFEPSEEVLTKFGLNKPETKDRLDIQNKLTQSVYSTKKTVKLEPGYQDWEKIKQRQQEFNKMNQADIIKQYHKDLDEEYLIADKKRGKLHLMKGDKEIVSYNIGTGENFGDEQTRTWVDKETKKVDWSKGNKQTGAGIYTASLRQEKNKEYFDTPAWNFKNEYGIEVPMAIHAVLPERLDKLKDKDESNNRVSNGCINGICYDLKDLYKRGYKEGQKLYILPDDDNNKFELKNGKLVFTSSNPNVNRTVNTLNYKPIKLELDERKFKEEVFTAFDFNDESELETTKSFIKSLQDNKQKVMKAAKINGDTYNDIAKIAFGIYGAESNFGDTHSAIGNFGRAINKYFNKTTASSPDVESKANTYGMDDADNSVGYTQIKWSKLTERELKTLRELGIKSNKDFLDPEKSAIATTAILAIRYQEQLNSDQKRDIEKYLPSKWNSKANYSDRIKTNSKYLSIKQLN